MTALTHSRLQLWFFAGLFLLTVVVAFLVFRPFVDVLALAAIVAVVLHPVYQWVRRQGKIGPRLAALAVIVAALLLLIAALSFIVTKVFYQAQNLYMSLSIGNAGSFVDTATALIEQPVQRFWPQFNFNLRDYLNQGLEWSFANLGSLVSGTVTVGIKTLLWLLALYYFLKDGSQMVRSVIKLSPLGDDYDELILKRLAGTINTVIRGFLAVAVVQGLLAGIGLAVFGVPNATLWGGVAAFAALVPGLGTALVLAPAVAYLWLSGSVGSALGLVVWGAVIVGLVDNVLAPYLYSRGGPIHPLFMLFAVLGGLAFFGPAGFILGPVTLSLLIALLDIYRREPAVAASS